MSKPSRVEAAKKAAELEASKRPFRNHYAGMHIGACASAESAMVAAFKHLVYGEASKATIVGPRDNDVARLHWTSFGISVWAPPEAFHRPKIADKPAADPRPKLRRVA